MRYENSLKIPFEEDEVKREGEKKKFLLNIHLQAHSAVIACLFSFFKINVRKEEEWHEKNII